MTDLRNTSTTSLLSHSLYPTTGLVALVGGLLATLTIWTAFGNCLVFISLIRYFRMRTTPNLLIGNLALSDFLLAISVLPLSISNDLVGFWPFGKVMCNLWLSFDVFYCTASVWGLVMIACDRYTATSFPVWYRNHRGGWRRAFPYVIFVWLFSCLICIPPLIGWDGKSFVHPMVKFSKNYVVDNQTGLFQCILFSEPYYVIYSALGSFIIPLAVMGLLYTKIFILMQQRAKAMRNTCSLRSQPSLLIRSNHHNEVLQDEADEKDSDSVASFSPKKKADNNSEDVEMEIKLESDFLLGSSDNSEKIVMIEIKKKSNRVDEIRDQEITRSPRLSRLKSSMRMSTRTTKSSTSDVGSRPPRRNFSIYRKRRSENSQIHAADKRERRATKRMALIMSVFALCWIPFTLMYIIRSLCGEDRCPDVAHPRMFVIWLGYANSGINPILYTLFNEDFRQAFINVLCGRKRKLLRRLSTITGQSFSV